MSKITYKVVEEWSAPTYYEHYTHNELYDESQATVQALWVVSYDEENGEIDEWLERFYIGEDDKAEERAKELNRENSDVRE